MSRFQLGTVIAKFYAQHTVVPLDVLVTFSLLSWVLLSCMMHNKRTMKITIKERHHHHFKFGNCCWAEAWIGRRGRRSQARPQLGNYNGKSENRKPPVLDYTILKGLHSSSFSSCRSESMHLPAAPPLHSAQCPGSCALFYGMPKVDFDIVNKKEGLSLKGGNPSR